jgi:hypothetical protein
MTSAELLLHPVRLRIVQACLGRSSVTTAELHEELDDVGSATLYRHVKLLAERGVLEVVGEQRVRGATERSYALRANAGLVALDDLRSLSADEHKYAFTAFVAALLADFGRYVDAGDVDYVRDGVGYRQVALWLTDDELATMTQVVNRSLAPYLGHAPGTGRRRRLLSTVLVPSREPQT